MHIVYFVGWDVSKATVNYCLRSSQEESLPILEEGQTSNTPSAITKLLNKWVTKYKCRFQDFLHCAENTGMYCNPLRKVADQLRLNFWFEDAFQLSRSMGRIKDKNDKVDARRIAEYCIIHKHKARIYKASNKIHLQIDRLQKLRTKLVRQRQALKTAHQEQQKFDLVDMPQAYYQVHQTCINTLDEQIRLIELELKTLIHSDEQIKRKYEIALSVPAVGEKTVLTILSITGCFERIKTARACASYAGVCPHAHTSGTSIRKRSKTSRAASKQLKTVLTQGLVFVVHKPHLPYYDLYTRLIAKGRTHRQALNAARNKLLRILFACIRNDVMYDKNRHTNLHSL